MPRKKEPPKFKYTTRKKDRHGQPILYVVYPVAGEKHPIWKKPVSETQEAVNEAIKEIQGEHRIKLSAGIVPRRCSEFFDFWLKLVAPNVTERTLEDRRGKIDKYLRPEFGLWELREIKPVMIQMLYARLAPVLAPNTTKKLHSVGHLIFKEAVNLEIIPMNPFERVRPPKVRPTQKVQVMSLDESRRFLDLAANSKHGTLFEFALETGMRPQEYLALRWSDIDLKKRRVEVKRAVVFHKKGGDFYFKETKTGSSRRTITLSPDICEKIKQHRVRQNEYVKVIEERLARRYRPSQEFKREHNRKLLEHHAEQNLLFPNEDFTPFSDINLGRRYFKPMIKTLGLSSDLTLYALRHTSISMLIAAGANIKAVSLRAGHSNINITLQTYTHLMTGQDPEVTDKISSILYPPKTGDNLEDGNENS